MDTIYILVASGKSTVFEGRKQIICKTAFRKLPTEEQKSAFCALCTQQSKGRIDDIEPRTINIQIIELAIEDKL